MLSNIRLDRDLADEAVEMNSYISSPIPASRPNLESIGRSASTGIYGGDEAGTDNEAAQTGDESDSVSGNLLTIPQR